MSKSTVHFYCCRPGNVKGCSGHFRFKSCGKSSCVLCCWPVLEWCWNVRICFILVIRISCFVFNLHRFDSRSTVYCSHQVGSCAWAGPCCFRGICSSANHLQSSEQLTTICHFIVFARCPQNVLRWTVLIQWLVSSRANKLLNKLEGKSFYAEQRY